MTIFTCGDCPVCGPMGDLVVLKARADGLFFVSCPRCGCAWREPPPPYTVDSVDPIEALAPDGFGLPLDSDLGELARRGWNVTPLEALDDDWRERLGPGFRAF